MGGEKKEADLLSCLSSFSFVFSAQRLPHDLLSKPDPYFILSRELERGNRVPVYESEVLKHNFNPEWNFFTVPLQRLCNGDSERALFIDVYNKTSKRTEYLGGFEVSHRVKKYKYTLTKIF